MHPINGKTKIICLLGNPVEHSLSPLIHNYGFKKLNINAIYINHKVEDQDLRGAVEGMRALGYQGCNVTYPHKIRIMDFLDELSQEAKLIGAVNTIKNEKGKLIGYNTDGLGFIKGLTRKGIDLDGKEICILGAGGAAKSIAVALAMNFDCNVVICNRSIEKPLEILKTINSIDKGFSVKHRYIQPQTLDTNNIDIMINCTPVGMEPNINDIPFNEVLKFHKQMVVCDIIYHPLETALLKSAKAQHCKIHHGLDMLIDQGILAFEIWTGERLDFMDLKKYLSERLYQT